MRIAINPPRFLSCQTICLFKLQPLLLPIRGSIKFQSVISPANTLGLFLRCRAMASSPPCVQVKEKIDLTEKEEQIFERLLRVVRHFNLQTQLRVAGGWVRDKLLGKDCYDIDIALDNMLGKEFCEKVNEYLLCMGEERQGVAVIQSNPDQSKHLETARMRLSDNWIDFVNLRSEDYSENSRIPTMRFGTAKEDALRRDLTINSLFYNINTSSVEDFTERGLADLKSGRIVTPLPPKNTFLDDPLRVLRAIRFGARFGFVLDKELKEAAACDDVKAAISDKISRERIGHEIDLMISGNQPVKAMTYICDLLLFWVVFSLPPKLEPATSEGSDRHFIGMTDLGIKSSDNVLEDECRHINFPRLCIAYMDAAWNLMQLIGYSTFNDEERRLSLFAALFIPFRKRVYEDSRAKKIPIVDYFFRNSLKLKAGDAQAVINIHNASEKFISLIPLIKKNSISSIPYGVSDEDIQIAEVYWKREIIDVPVTLKPRIFAGFLLDEIKGLWRVALLLSTLVFPTNIDCTKDSSNECFGLDKRREEFKTVEDAIIELGLEKAWEVKPLVNGKDIMSVLQLKTGTPLVREWQQKLRQWQLAYPSGTAEECLDWMRETNSKRVKME